MTTSNIMIDQPPQDPHNTHHELGGGCIILLDVPPGTAIILDGITRVTPSYPTATAAAAASSSSVAAIPFNRGVWIIKNIPSRTSSSQTQPSDDLFHLLIVRCGIINSNGTTSTGDCRTLPVGFLLTSSSNTNTSNTCTSHSSGYDWIFARRYDPRTEEISNEPLDDLTLHNLIAAMGAGGELGKFAISYAQFMGESSTNRPNANANSNKIPPWSNRTSLIKSSYLEHCHGLCHGDKIVPSSDTSDYQGNSLSTENNNSNAQDNDGKSISYPSIPCIDPTINARQIAQHSGTRAYLSKLSPEKRTWLLFGCSDATANILGANNANCHHAGEFVWGDVLSRSYDNKEQEFLADIQLSFLLFLFLECHASLEHWRDAVSMCSLSLAAIPTKDGSKKNDSVNTVIPNKVNFVSQHPNFFLQLLTILKAQLSCIETDFFQEVEYSSGENNFLVGALQRLCAACDAIDEHGGNGSMDSATLEKIKLTSLKLEQMFWGRFQLDLSSTGDSSRFVSGGDGEMEIELLEPETNDKDANSVEDDGNDIEEYDEYDEDGPAIVPYDQVEASIARSSLECTQTQQHHSRKHSLKPDEKNYSQAYPLLYAAMASQEDVLMACARILEDANDVSLVREAAAYLEEVEAHLDGE